MNGKAFLVVLVSALLLSSGCLSIRHDDYGRILPRLPQWRLKKTAGDPHGWVRYGVAYVHVSDDPYHRGYEVVRFWPSGHFMSIQVDELDIKLIDAPGGVVGYYQAKPDRSIVAEIYTSINGGQYGYEIYRVEENGDILLMSWGPSLRWWQTRLPQPLRYRPMKIGELKMEPDW